MVSVVRVRNLLHDLHEHSDWRFAVGIRIRFANPTLLYQTYPQEWINYYNENGLIFVDPTVRWGLSHTGVSEWSVPVEDDEAGVMIKAAEHGLKYGVAVSVGEASARTLGFFWHAQRPLTPDEIAFASSHVQDLHDATDTLAEASEATIAQLRNLNQSLRVH